MLARAAAPAEQAGLVGLAAAVERWGWAGWRDCYLCLARRERPRLAGSLSCAPSVY